MTRRFLTLSPGWPGTWPYPHRPMRRLVAGEITRSRPFEAWSYPLNMREEMPLLQNLDVEYVSLVDRAAGT